MKILFLIFLLFVSVAASGTVYYIDPAGSDANNGSSGSPWKTLAYACSKVKTTGDIIHVNSGTYNEKAQSSLAIGVSIEGEGISSNIISTVSSSLTYTIILDASAEATNGNQHISGIRMDGSSLTAYGAISVPYRKNVEIYNCTFVDFKYYGVSFINGEPPSVYATGNKFHDNTVTNCSGYFSGNMGALEIGGQDGMLIYNNTITQNRSNGLNGDLIYGVAGYLKNVKIYNNVLNKTYIPGTTNWDFAIEFWNCQGGVEIYNNTVNGSIDLVNSVKGSADYSVWVHDNEIGQSVLLSSESTRGLIIEASQENVIIERNNIKNVSSGIMFSQVQSARVVKNVYIWCNIINNIGVSDAGASNKGWGIYWTAENLKNHTVDNINICNNVLIGHSGARANMWGINLPNIGKATNITLRNNIIQNFNYAPVYAYTQTGAETINILSIENNIFYLNGNSNAPKYTSITPTNNTTQNNLTSNPLFASSTDFHLQTGSPAIGKGIKVAGVTLDLDGNGFNDPPSIGAYEVNVPVIPAYRSSSVENATPSIIGITFNLSLANIVPAASAFSVSVNSVTRTVNSVAVSGNTVQLTLAGPVVYGDLVTVTYIVPSANPLQTSAGSKATAFSSQRVTNNVSALSPVYSGSSVENANPSLLTITYNMALANVTPAISAFAVSVNSSARSVSKVTVSGSTVQLTLASPVVYGDAVTVAYTRPSSNPLQSASGAQAASLSAQKVTNNVSPGIPVYVSSAIQNAKPNLLEMTYNLTLANIVPAASAFSVVVNSAARTVSTVAISGTKVQLTLSSPVVFGDIVTVAYTKPSANPVQTSAGAQAAALTAQNVTNNVSSASPLYVSSSVENATPSTLVINYNLALASVVPAASAFAVKVNTKTRTVSAVSVSGTKVQLTLSGAVVYGDAITIAYTKPSSNPLQSSAGAQAAAFTAQKVTNNVNPVYPVYVSSSIQNAKPNLLEMTYSLTLANVVPAASAFTVIVNSSARAVNTVAISGTKVQLTLSSPVVYGDVITVAYTKPSGNPLQTSSGIQAVTITAQAVTNNVSSPSPLYVSSSVENAAPSSLVINYNMALASVVPAASAFSVKVNTTARTVSAVSVSGTKVQLTLSGPVVYGDAITIAYTKPSSNPLQSSLGSQVATFSAQKVTNNINPVYAVYVSSVVQNANPYLIEMTYSIPLANVVPAASAFSVAVNSVARTVSSVTVSGTKVQLALASPIVSSDVVTVAYTKPATRPLQTSLGVQAVTIGAQSVTNNTINVPPVVSIISPANNSEFNTSSDITITANATDADGSVKSVEFYNGSTLLGTVSASPFTFTWNTVDAGTYSLTAVATDNLNTKTVSSAISITVTDQVVIVNQPPVVMIANPTKGDQYDDPADINIDVIASDPDGTITKVELYNGSVKLTELTTAPYSYTWKGVTAGNYAITAVATDNSNATSTSSPIEFLIGQKATYDPKGDYINLYPNPNSGQFTIEVTTPLQSAKSEIIFTDLSGNKVYSDQILREESSKQFDLSRVKPGIYIMSVIDNQILITKKFVKK